MRTPLIEGGKPRKFSPQIFLILLCASFAFILILQHLIEHKETESGIGVNPGKLPFVPRSEGRTNPPPNSPRPSPIHAVTVVNPRIQSPQQPPPNPPTAFASPFASPNPPIPYQPQSSSQLSALQTLQQGINLPRPPSDALRPVPINPNPSSAQVHYVPQIYPPTMDYLPAREALPHQPNPNPQPLLPLGLGAQYPQASLLSQPVHVFPPALSQYPQASLPSQPVIVFPSASQYPQAKFSSQPVHVFPSTLSQSLAQPSFRHASDPYASSTPLAPNQPHSQHPIASAFPAQPPLQHSQQMQTAPQNFPAQPQLQHSQQMLPPAPQILPPVVVPHVPSTRAPSQSPTKSPNKPSSESNKKQAVEGLLHLDLPASVEGSQTQPEHRALTGPAPEGSSSQQWTYEDNVDRIPQSDSPEPIIQESDRPIPGPNRGRGRGRGRGPSRGGHLPGEHGKRSGRKPGSGLKKIGEKVASAEELKFALDQVLGNMYPEPNESLKSFAIRVVEEMRAYLKQSQLMFYQDVSVRGWFQERVTMAYNFYTGKMRGSKEGGSSGAGPSNSEENPEEH